MNPTPGPALSPMRLLALTALALSVWGLTQLLTPNPERLEALVLDDAAGAVTSLETWPKDGARATTFGPSDPACHTALQRGLGDKLTIRAAAKVDLTLGCTRDAHGFGLSLESTDTSGKVTSASAPLKTPTTNSLLPPLFGILFALIFRRVLLALGSAVVLGALMAADWSVIGGLEKLTDYFVGTIWDSWNLYILGFTVLLVGLVHVCIRSGGMQGIVNALSRFARGRRSAQATAGVMGCAIFFDDYANTVVVGSTVQPLTDRHGVSREKLAYIVDSTAAPIAGVAIVSTWIGFEIDAFQQQLQHIAPVASSGYEFFFAILPYRFYCLLALALVFIIALTGRDFGPMRAAEQRARNGVLSPRAAAGAHSSVMKPGAPPRWYNGVLPIVAVIVGTLITAVFFGLSALDAKDAAAIATLTESGGNVAAFVPWDAGLGFFGRVRDAFIAASDDTIAILFWASASGAALALVLAWGQRILTVREGLAAFGAGARAVAPILAILILAIALRKVTDDLGTPKVLAALMGDVALWVLPVAVFFLAAFIAFSTGTSWGTMSILIPIVIPLVATLSDGGATGQLVLILTAASVLDGAIFGDHCSLISDTTIMSSLSSGCDHVDHVRTQLPYALLAMLAAAGFGYFLLSAVPDFPVWLTYIIGVGWLVLWVRLVGRRPTLAA